jgi:hypothetical protein
MREDLFAITNLTFTGNESEKDWNLILDKLKSINLEKTLTVENDELIRKNCEWSYDMNIDPEYTFLVDFNGPFQFNPIIFSNIGIICTNLNYGILYHSQELSTFNAYRRYLYDVVRVFGGTEVIFLAYEGCDQLSNILDKLAFDNVPYEVIKEEMILRFGNPVTDYNKLDADKLNFENITEFILDDFSDLKI